MWGDRDLYRTEETEAHTARVGDRGPYPTEETEAHTARVVGCCMVPRATILPVFGVG